MNEEEYLEKFIEIKIPKHLRNSFPKHLWNSFSTIVGAIKAGFYEGIKFERSKYRGVPGAICPNCNEQGIQNYHQSNATCPNCGCPISINST